MVVRPEKVEVWEAIGNLSLEVRSGSVLLLTPAKSRRRI